MSSKVHRDSLMCVPKNRIMGFNYNVYGCIVFWSGMAYHFFNFLQCCVRVPTDLQHCLHFILWGSKIFRNLRCTSIFSMLSLCERKFLIFFFVCKILFIFLFLFFLNFKIFKEVLNFKEVKHWSFISLPLFLMVFQFFPTWFHNDVLLYV